MGKEISGGTGKVEEKGNDRRAKMKKKFKVTDEAATAAGAKK